MTLGKELLYLSRKDVEAVGLTIDECIDILEKAHMDKAAGRVEMPKKPQLGDPTGDGFMFAYLAQIGDDQIGMKWLGARPANKRFGLPQINATIILNDPQTFVPFAIMDGTSITGMRTSGVSGIAMRHLARRDSESIAILGCGYQGRMHLRVAATVCKNLKRVYAWSPNFETASRFAAEMRTELSIPVEALREPSESVKAADIVVFSTPIGGLEDFALLHKDWFKDGVTVISISQVNHFFADAFLSFDKYFVDEHETMRLVSQRRGFEAGAQLPARELGEMLLYGEAGRENDAQRILFISEGIAVNDIAVGSEIYKRALKQGIGTVLPL